MILLGDYFYVDINKLKGTSCLDPPYIPSIYNNSILTVLIEYNCNFDCIIQTSGETEQISYQWAVNVAGNTKVKTIVFFK